MESVIGNRQRNRQGRNTSRQAERRGRKETEMKGDRIPGSREATEAEHINKRDRHGRQTIRRMGGKIRKEKDRKQRRQDKREAEKRQTDNTYAENKGNTTEERNMNLTKGRKKKKKGRNAHLLNMQKVQYYK